MSKLLFPSSTHASFAELHEFLFLEQGVAAPKEKPALSGGF